MKRSGKPRGQYYLSHQTIDTDCGIITGVTVTPGDAYDSVPYLEQLEHIHWNVIPFQAAEADSAYDFPLAHWVLEKQGIAFFVRPQPTYDRTNAEMKRDTFSYDAEQDAYICPTGKLLRLNTLHRSASGLYWLYQAISRTAKAAHCVKSVWARMTDGAPGNWNTAILHPNDTGIWLTDMTLSTQMHLKSGRSGVRVLLPLRSGGII